jgi:hypothetical protein
MFIKWKMQMQSKKEFSVAAGCVIAFILGCLIRKSSYMLDAVVVLGPRPINLQSSAMKLLHLAK